MRRFRQIFCILLIICCMIPNTVNAAENDTPTVGDVFTSYVDYLMLAHDYTNLYDIAPDGVPQHIWDIARKYETEHINAYVLCAVAYTESSFNPKCVTGVCYGLMQIHKVWEFYRFKDGETWDDPDASMRVCAEILNEWYDRYDSLSKALMVYNEGWSGDRDGDSGYSRKVKKYAAKYEDSHIAQASQYNEQLTASAYELYEYGYIAKRAGSNIEFANTSDYTYIAHENF